jgi:transposase
MSESTLIGIDLAKNIFRINCVDENGKRVMNKSLHRNSLIKFFTLLPKCMVAMEACASFHYWGSTIESLGHRVKLIHPRYVTPYRLGDKNCQSALKFDPPCASKSDLLWVSLFKGTKWFF